MSNKIKQGDKVRVSKDAPRIYTPDWVETMFNLVLKVTAVEDGNAMVVFAERTPYRTVLTTIPCKYLVKVDAEAKEAKLRFKEYDTVRVKKDCKSYNELIEIMAVDESDKSSTYLGDDGEWYADADLEPYTAPTIKVGDRVEELISRKSGRVLSIEGDFVVVGVPYDKEKHYWHIDAVELVEPTEQPEASVDVLGEFTPISMSINPIIGFEQEYWQEYEADLAKEIALKVANKFNTPHEAAEYAVSVAKAVVYNLKNKQI